MVEGEEEGEEEEARLAAEEPFICQAGREGVLGAPPNGLVPVVVEAARDGEPDTDDAEGEDGVGRRAIKRDLRDFNSVCKSFNEVA